MIGMLSVILPERLRKSLFLSGAGLTGVEIGKMLGVDYSTVSQGRKRLREKLKRDKELRALMERIEDHLSIRKN
ncbi:MAG: hypothetical protein L6290_04415 [Thermodesulfovibrionales bacterium]|nr:hypothetical protein [Thermodesulfovibrionales bacterium]